jgi:cytochrome c-type biogenesis protein CcsB
MKKSLKIFFSMPFMGAVLIIYAIAMAVATFIENEYGAAIAKHVVYNAWWFELIQLILVINFIGNIFTYKLYKKAKLSIFMFHAAFAIILVGAAVTRYIGYEGSMSIREGESANTFLSEKDYLQVKSATNESKLFVDKKAFVSPYINNNLSAGFESNNKSYNLELTKILPNAEKKYMEDVNGRPFLEIVFASKFGMQNYFIEDQSEISFQDQAFSLNASKEDSAVSLTLKNGQLYAKLPYDLKIIPMTGGTDSTLLANEQHLLQTKQLYSFKDIKFVVKEFSENAKLSYTVGDLSGGIKYNLLEFTINSPDESKTVYVPASNGAKGENVLVRFKDDEFVVSYGAKEVELPFEIKLRDFQLDRYPGSNSPSSYASEVTLIDKEENINMEYRIFMNNILEHKGFRFYQSSYDRDEKGTVLSVNHDKAGTIITYLGYLLLAIGMFWSIFNKNTHFAELIKRTSEIHKKRLTSLIILFALFSGQNLFAQQEEGIKNIDAEHAKLFGTVQTQDLDGRIKPYNTLSSELLRKVARKEKFEGLTPNQVMLGMMFNPKHWQDVKMIKISHPELNRILGFEGKYISFNQLVNMEKGEYKLKAYVDAAFEKKPALRDKFDKEVITVDERVNLCYQVYSGKFLKVFPVPGDIHHPWLIPTQIGEIKDSTKRAYAASVFSDYYDAMLEAQQSNDWRKADEVLKSLIEFQKTNAEEIILSDTRVKLEIQYVNANIFKHIYMYYGLIGFILLIILFVGILRPAMKVKMPIIASAVLLGLLFLYHTYGLALRWYLSGHAPWSNGYESMIYLGWGIMLLGFIFAKKLNIVLAAAAILASVTLMVANLAWMDPEITNLVPVLKSYWLVIHVAVITISYAFFGIAAILGLLVLILMILKTRQNAERIQLALSEIANVNHMIMIVGLYLMTIGTFLGGVWANESWGRYWGWDPKETWALITVIVYSFIVHMRFIRGMNNSYSYSVFSIFGFFVVLMTYFGVNYYLSGLHSYAAGDPLPIPTFVPVTVGVLVVIAIIAYFRNHVKSVEVKTE